MKRSLLIFTVVWFSVLYSKAQTIIIDGEIRPRTEFQDGYSKPIGTANDPGVFTTQRTRLNFAYSNALISTMVSLQDARVFGQEAQTSSTATVGIYQAWAEVLFFQGLTLKIGRQAVCFDDNRLFSSPQWSNTGTAHDMGLMKYSIDNWQFQLAAAFNNNSANASETFYTQGANYRSMNVLHITKPLSDGLSISAIAVDEGVQDTVGIGTAYTKMDMNHCYTFGGNLKFQNIKIPVSAKATAYFQAGKSATGKMMNGKLLAIKADFKFSNTITANIGTDYLSGDANGTSDGILSNFKKLYGADHTFNGYMDYWNTPPTKGLLDYYASGAAKLGKNLCFELGYHLFNTDKPLKNSGVEVGKDLGSEMDFLVTYKINNWSTVQSGYCRYFDTSNTLIAKSMATNTVIRSPQWAYLMFTFKIKPPTPKGEQELERK